MGSCNLKEIFNKTLYRKLHIQNNKMSAAPSGKGSGLTKPMKVSADLAEIIGMKEASRAQCIKMLWKYLKDHNPARPRKQAILLPRQKDGQDLWTRKDSCIWNGKVFGCPLDSNLNFC